eukprot:jgi/Botrbrau1/21010/Bobra.0144s0026.1
MSSRIESNVPFPKRKTHFCLICDHPIATYGYLWPCRHVFCLTCASKMTKCTVCGHAIQTLENVSLDQRLLVSPATGQALKTDFEFFHHIHAARARLQEIRRKGVAKEAELRKNM